RARGDRHHSPGRLGTRPRVVAWSGDQATTGSTWVPGPASCPLPGSRYVGDTHRLVAGLASGRAASRGVVGAKWVCPGGAAAGQPRPGRVGGAIARPVPPRRHPGLHRTRNLHGSPASTVAGSLTL